MTYVVTEACIRCKYMDCVEVCPVDCFYEGENMLVIHPDECIDCGVCEPECPVDAIIPDSEQEADRWVELNREYAAPGRTSPARSRNPPMPTSGRRSPTNTRSSSARSLAGPEACVGDWRSVSAVCAAGMCDPLAMSAAIHGISLTVPSDAFLPGSALFVKWWAVAVAAVQRGSEAPRHYLSGR